MIYVDHNATSPLLPEVLDAMQPWLGVPCNSSSVHRAGQAAAVAVEQARESVAALVAGDPAGVVFTSGATEATHTFLRALPMLTEGRVLWVGDVEHPSVYGAAAFLAQQGWAVHRGGEPPTGASAVSQQAANHETGIVQHVPAVPGALVHVDATQAAGKLPLRLDVDGISLSAHKLGGPMGVGALVLRSGDAFPPLLTGGAQERGRRAGTVNVPGVVGFGAAARLALDELDERTARWTRQRSTLQRAITQAGGRVIGTDAARIPNTVCAVFGDLLGETLVQALDLRGIAVSSGAACASGSTDPSPVLIAMGEANPAGGLRISLGPRSTDGEVEQVARGVVEVVGALR